MAKWGGSTFVCSFRVVGVQLFGCFPVLGELSGSKGNGALALSDVVGWTAKLGRGCMQGDALMGWLIGCFSVLERR